MTDLTSEHQFISTLCIESSILVLSLDLDHQADTSVTSKTKSGQVIASKKMGEVNDYWPSIRASIHK